MSRINSITQNFIQPKNRQYHNTTPSQQKKETNTTSTIFTRKNVIIGGSLLCAIAGLAIYLKTGKPTKPTTPTNNISPQTNSQPTININDIIITGVEEVKQILSKLTPEDFDTTRTFKANLHIHSTKSDGKLTPLEILSQAAELGNKLPPNEKFVFSLTDHDSIEGIKEITEEISKNPHKYSKIKFIPGIEISAKYHNSTLSNKPVEFDFLIYGFDSNNEKLIKETTRRRNYLTEKTNALFRDINTSLQDTQLSFENMQKTSHLRALRNLCSNGYLHCLKNWLKTMLGERYNDSFINNKLEQHFGSHNFAYDANLDLLSAIKLAKETNSLSSIAHPGRFNFVHSEVQGDHIILANDIFKTFMNNGGNALEANYMGYKSGQHWWDKLQKSFESFNIPYYKTGGYDSHGTNIAQKN